jgi:SAM-dependent methyltransferase
MYATHMLPPRRPLSDGYPDLAKLAKKQTGAAHAPTNSALLAGLKRQLAYLERIAAVERGRVLVVGCGPQPQILSFLVEHGFDAVGLEPISSFVCSAREFVGSDERVVQGTTEQMPLPDDSVDLVYANSVLEHVDSVGASLRGMYRVLKPGGLAYLITTNRWRLSLSGDNGEYNTPFFSWFPSLVKECFVFHHLHHDPSLANFSERPAVHWFTFSELCELGREAGFGHFYSPVDVMDATDEPFRDHPMRRMALQAIQGSPFMRAAVLAFTAVGGSIVMMKRR